MLWTTFGFHFFFALVGTILICAVKCCKCCRRCRTPPRSTIVNEAAPTGSNLKNNSTLAADLSSLASLHTQGHITHAEFMQAKAQLLGQENSAPPQYSSAPLLNQPSGYP